MFYASEKLEDLWYKAKPSLTKGFGFAVNTFNDFAYDVAKGDLLLQLRAARSGERLCVRPIGGSVGIDIPFSDEDIRQPFSDEEEQKQHIECLEKSLLELDKAYGRVPETDVPAQELTNTLDKM